MSPEIARYYRFATYRLDTRSRELCEDDGARVPMSGKPFDTLTYLIEHRDHVVSRDELLAAVWPGRIVEENTLTQAIAALRRALGTQPCDHRFIVTVPGRGYRFVADVREDDAAEHRDVVVAPRLRAKWLRRLLFTGVGLLLTAFAVAAVVVAP